jgi:hypothetical protein
VSSRVLADALVAFHFAFILFVVSGGFLAVRWPRVAWLHVPCAVWGASVEAFGWICPLTPLENRLRAEAGQQGYAGGFLENYVIPVMYPAELTRQVQLGLAAVVVVLNVAAYALVLRRTRRRAATA